MATKQGLTLAYSVGIFRDPVSVVVMLALTPIIEVIVANSAQARKRARQSEKRRQHNASLRSHFRTVIKNVRKALDADNVEAAKTAYVAAVPVIDGMARKNIVHKNKAARLKSRLSDQIKAHA